MQLKLIWRASAILLIVIGIGYALWKTNQAWTISHDCQCGEPYGLARTDYVVSHAPLTILPFVLIGGALLFHPIAGVIAATIIASITLIMALAPSGSANPYNTFDHQSMFILLILYLFGIILSVVWAALKRRM